MDYARAELADRLAAEYVLGTLRGPARRRFQTLLAAHPALRSAVQRWEDRLAPLAASVAPVAPPERVWTGIEARLFGQAPSGRGWNALAKATDRELRYMYKLFRVNYLELAKHEPPKQMTFYPSANTRGNALVVYRTPGWNSQKQIEARNETPE